MKKRFRVALSFPGEQRNFVREVAGELASVLGRNKILYDDYHQAELARPNLDVYLGKLYHDESELIVPFFCAEYEKKEWCGLEWRQIRDLLKKGNDIYIMPFRFDDAPVAGQLSIDGYIKVGTKSSQQVANLILERLAVVNVDVVDGPDLREASGPLYYIFASEGSHRSSSETAFYAVNREDLAHALVNLFTKEYSTNSSKILFHSRPASSLPPEEQLFISEALDWLRAYEDPDRGVYDPPPPVQMHRLAQFAVRAENWENLLRKQPPNNSADGSPNTGMPPDQRLNFGLTLLMLLAQTYYKLLESTVCNKCQALDLNLNQSYFWTVSMIQNLLSNHEDLCDFPSQFEPYFDDLYPTTILDVDWEDMVAPHAENFLSTVQRYVMQKGICEPEEGSHAAILVAFFRPSIDSCLQSAEEYRTRMRVNWKRIAGTEVKPEPKGSPTGEHEENSDTTV